MNSDEFRVLTAEITEVFAESAVVLLLQKLDLTAKIPLAVVLGCTTDLFA
jgi:hypothetical protein